jgi:hypothetical protein
MTHSHQHVADLAHLCLADRLVDVEIQSCSTDGLHQVRSMDDQLGQGVGKLLLATWDGSSRSGTTGRPLLLPAQANGKEFDGESTSEGVSGLELIGVGGLMWLDRRSWEQLLGLVVEHDVEEPPIIEEVLKLDDHNFFAADAAAEMAAAVTHFLNPQAASVVHVAAQKPSGEAVLRQFVRFASCGAFTVFERDF